MCALSHSHHVEEIKNPALRTWWCFQNLLIEYCGIGFASSVQSLGHFFFELNIFNLSVNVFLFSYSFREDPKPDLAVPSHNTFNFKLTPFLYF